MGADLLLTSVPAFEPTNERLELLHQAVKELTPESEGFDEFVELFLSVREEENGLDNEVHKLLADAVNSIPSFHNSRSTVRMRWEGMDYDVSVTGGDSWGDDPNEYYGPMGQLGTFTAIDKLSLKFAKEDFKQSHPE